MTTTTTTLRCPNAELAGATLAGATLAGATLAGATLAGATLAGATPAGASVSWPAPSLPGMHEAPCCALPRARLDRAPLLARNVLRALQHLQRGHLRLRTPDGHWLDFHGRDDGLSAELHIHDWQVLVQIARRSDIGLAEAYAAQRCDSPDWVALLRLAQHNQDALEQLFNGSWLAKLGCLLRHWTRRNSRAGSRRNIHAHYDLGNDFYRLWLDASMTYSSALFDGDFHLPLQQAQERKYRNILDWLRPSAGASVLEIGCGWGGFAELATRNGLTLTGLTLSTEQLAWARQRLQAAGLGEQAQLLLQDYRDHHQQYDHIVSIEMFEAVGEHYWPTYFRQVYDCLRPGGSAVVQTITIGERWFDNYRRNTDFIQQYIFPGGMLPSPYAFRTQAEYAGLKVERTMSFGFDYAETLRRWREQFEAVLPHVREQGFDERFVRLWRFYLVYCEAGFLEGRIDVQQTLLRRPA